MNAEHDDRSRLFVPAFVIGWGIIIAGAMTALHNARDAHPFALAVHLVTFDLGHDLLLVPTALAIGWLVGKLVPAVARGPVRSALAVSAMFSLFAYPLIRRWGQRPTNSSTLPLDYGRNLTIVLVLVWLVAIITIVRRSLSGRPKLSAMSGVAAVELLEGTHEEIDHLAGCGADEQLVVEVPGDLDGATHLGEVFEAVGAAGEVPVDRVDEALRKGALEVVGDELGPLLTDDDPTTEPHDAPPN